MSLQSAVEHSQCTPSLATRLLNVEVDHVIAYIYCLVVHFDSAK